MDGAWCHASQKHFGGSLRFVFRNFPLSQIHPLAEPAAEATEFAAAHGKFWELHDAIFEHQSRLSLNCLVTAAGDHGPDPQALSAALDQGNYAERVKKDFLSGVRSGVNGTPSFFINGQRHDGPAEFDSLSESIEAARQRPSHSS